MRYYSLFSGIEAASCAWEPLGWEPLLFSEIEPFPCKVLETRFPDVPNIGDIREVDWNECIEIYGRPDVIVGGSPCQSFSVAGGREGLAGESGLMFEYIRAVRDVRPRWFVWENVTGALSSEDGGAFNQLLCEMADCGYGLAWRVLDSQFFDVAQRRERVFLVGSLGTMRCAEVLFDEEGLRRDFKTGRKKREELTAALEAGDRGIHAYSAKLRHTGSPMLEGKSGGVGPLVQTECSATLGTSNDQTLIHEPIGFKYHQGARSRSLGDDIGVSPTVTADYHQPAVVYSRTYRPHFKGDAETWAETGLANTLNCNDAPSDSRFNEIVCMTDTQPNTMVDGEVCGAMTRRMHKDPPVLCMADDNGKTAMDTDVCGTLKVGGGSSYVCSECTGPLCARDYKGVGSQYVNEGKLICIRYRVTS